MEKEALFLTFNLITRADRHGWVISFCVSSVPVVWSGCRPALRTSEPNAPFPFPAVQKGSAGPNFPPENANSFSIKLLPAEPFVSGLNYPVGGAFHLDPGLLLFITDGAWLHSIMGEIHSVKENEKVNRRQLSVVNIPSSTVKLSKAFQSLLGLHKLVHHGFSLKETTPFQAGLKHFLASFLLSLLEWSFPQRWDSVTKVQLKGLNGWEPPANPILISWW